MSRLQHAEADQQSVLLVKKQREACEASESEPARPPPRHSSWETSTSWDLLAHSQKSPLLGLRPPTP